MTARRGLPVWLGRVLRGMTALALALAAFVIAATPGAAMGRPPLLDDQPPPAASAPSRPAVTVPPCPEASDAAQDVERHHRDPACPSPLSAAPVSVARPAPAATPASRPAPPAGPVVAPRTAATPTPAPLRALPIPPPIWLAPTLAPVPQSYAAELAPTSVLVLGFGSVALASTVMALRLLRGGR